MRRTGPIFDSTGRVFLNNFRQLVQQYDVGMLRFLRSPRLPRMFVGAKPFTQNTFLAVAALTVEEF